MGRCADGTFYTGIAKDVAHRAKVHNSGRGAKYTRSRLPFVVVYCEGPMPGRSARVRERSIKQLDRAAKAALADAGV
ncbi:MAG: GIY-YIG nuclease family protein [Armatimonadetes bacterium]|nr:GIY-YIG nuclease family protein [Armatimonadota bacterium]